MVSYISGGYTNSGSGGSGSGKPSSTPSGSGKPSGTSSGISKPAGVNISDSQWSKLSPAQQKNVVNTLGAVGSTIGTVVSTYGTNSSSNNNGSSNNTNGGNKNGTNNSTNNGGKNPSNSNGNKTNPTNNNGGKKPSNNNSNNNSATLMTDLADKGSSRNNANKNTQATSYTRAVQNGQLVVVAKDQNGKTLYTTPVTNVKEQNGKQMYQNPDNGKWYHFTAENGSQSQASFNNLLGGGSSNTNGNKTKPSNNNGGKKPTNNNGNKTNPSNNNGGKKPTNNSGNKTNPSNNNGGKNKNTSTPKVEQYYTKTVNGKLYSIGTDENGKVVSQKEITNVKEQNGKQYYQNPVTGKWCEAKDGIATQKQVTQMINDDKKANNQNPGNTNQNSGNKNKENNNDAGKRKTPSKITKNDGKLYTEIDGKKEQVFLKEDPNKKGKYYYIDEQGNYICNEKGGKRYFESDDPMYQNYINNGTMYDKSLKINPQNGCYYYEYSDGKKPDATEDKYTNNATKFKKDDTYTYYHVTDPDGKTKTYKVLNQDAKNFEANVKAINTFESNGGNFSEIADHIDHIDGQNFVLTNGVTVSIYSNPNDIIAQAASGGSGNVVNDKYNPIGNMSGTQSGGKNYAIDPSQLTKISRGYSSGHKGIDYVAPKGTPIYSVTNGVVKYASPSGSPHKDWGYYAVVEYTNSKGEKYDVIYGHMESAPVVSNGQVVTTGQNIGNVGNTGFTYGANGGYHLHLEVRQDYRAKGTGKDPKTIIPGLG